MELNMKFHPEMLEVIKTHTRSKVEEANAKGVVIGLSGGLDSAVVARICVDTFSPENVLAIFMPERETTPDEDYEHSKDFAKSLGMDYKIVDISEMIKLLKTHKEGKGLKPDPTTIGNLKARARMIILYYFANATNRLVAGTSNKSEILLGYFTKYGDGGADVMPIGDVYKTQIKLMAEHLNIPDYILKKPPAAGLVADQTDEQDLGYPYDILDKIILGIEINLESEKIAEIVGINVKDVERFRKRVRYTRHKRKFAKIPKVGIRTIGKDWRE
jgi:NAD+ synthase